MIRHFTVLAALLLISSGIQAWSIRHAVFPAQDTVRYVAVAQAIEREGPAPIVRRVDKPLFPVAVWAMQRGVAWWTGETAGNWAISAQLAAALPLILAVVPLYFLLLRWKGLAVAVAGTSFFCVLPEIARLGADGLGDAWHLLGAIVAISIIAAWLKPGRAHRTSACTTAFQARRGESHTRADGYETPTNRWNRLALVASATAGIVIGLAALARREVLILVPALFATLGWLRFRKARPTRVRTDALALLALGFFAAIPGPLVRHLADAVARRSDVDVAAASTLTADKWAALNFTPWRTYEETSPRRPVPMLTKETTVTSRFEGLAAAIREYSRESTGLLNYWIAALAVVGMFRSSWRDPGPVHVFGAAVCAALSVAVIAVAARHGYLSSRHLLLMTPFCVGWASDEALRLGNRLMRGWRPESAPSPISPYDLRPTRVVSTLAPLRPGVAVVLASSIALLSAVACLPRTLSPLHASRLPHRLAAHWLAQPERATGVVLDSRGLTSLYSGRVTYRAPGAGYALADPRLAYVVLEHWETELDSPRARQLRQVLAASAEPVKVFTTRHMPRARPVVIYRWHGPSHQHESPPPPVDDPPTPPRLARQPNKTR